MIEHTCEKCKFQITNDVCWCEACKDEEIQKAYGEGYEQAEKDRTDRK